jgi:hypothetical protein
MTTLDELLTQLKETHGDEWLTVLVDETLPDYHDGTRKDDALVDALHDWLKCTLATGIQATQQPAAGELFVTYRECAAEMMELIDLNGGRTSIATPRNPLSADWDKCERRLRELDFQLSTVLGDDDASHWLGMLVVEDLPQPQQQPAKVWEPVQGETIEVEIYSTPGTVLLHLSNDGREMLIYDDYYLLPNDYRLCRLVQPDGGEGAA